MGVCATNPEQPQDEIFTGNVLAKSDDQHYQTFREGDKKVRAGANITVQDLTVVVDEQRRVNTIPDNEKELEKLLLKKGFYSNEETMKAKTDEIILTIEERENLQDFLKSLEANFTAARPNEEIKHKEVIQFNDGSFYKGTWNKDMKKHGVGTLLLIGGSKYGGEFVNDNIEGKGYFIDTNGKFYFGDFKNGKANGKGRILCEKEPGYLYEGNFENNLFNGYAEERLPIGTIYKGQFTNGSREPHGLIIFPEGSIYEGEVKKNIMEGKGTFKWKDGRVYEGEFQGNKLHGKGKTTWIDGSYYEGDYKNDQYNGYGILVSADGTTFKGNWLNNQIHGVGYYKDAEQEYKGLWRYNKLIKKF